MKASGISLSRSYSGEVILSLVVDRESIKAAETAFDSLKGKDIEVTVKKYSKRRSVDANRYFWVLAGKLAAKIGSTKEEVYRQYIPDIGDTSEVVPIRNDVVEAWCKAWCRGHLGRMTETYPSKLEGYTNVVAYLSSSDFTTAQMSRLIDLIVADCKEQGIETATPSELALLLEEWK